MFEQLIVWYRIFFVWLYGHVGFALAILSTSVITSFLMKPIAKVIMKWVKREIEYEGVLNPLVAEIKSSDKSGAEKQFALAELYKQYGYSPILEVRKVLPLFVQLPCLFLTYYMLEGAEILKGVSFLCFKDVGAADALLPMGVNLLPFVMTGINFIAIYSTPSFTRKDRIQAIVVALAFLVLLYPACAALMIYWTLNNLFTCLKTLTEEHYSGARLLCGRVKWACCGGAWNAVVRAVRELQPQTYALGAFVCFLLAMHSYLVLTGKYGGGSFSGKVAANTMNFFAVSGMLLLSVVCVELRKWLLLFAGIVLSVHAFILVDRVVIKIPALAGRQQLMLVWLLFIQTSLGVILLLSKRLRKPFRCHMDISLKELLLHGLVIASVACHYLCANRILGLSVSSFVIFILSLQCGYFILGLSGWLLLGDKVELKLILRTSLLGSVIFYLMPLFVSGTGWMFPSKNIWQYWAVFVITGFVFTFVWKKSCATLNVFLFIASLSLIGNGVKSVVVNSEIKDGVPSMDKAESFSYLNGHEIVNPCNIYLLVYDGWANAYIGDHYGVYNPLPELERRGFSIYPKSYMPMRDTLSCMSLFFDIFNDTKLPKNDILSGRAKCLRFLRANNYHMSYVLDEYCIKNTYLPLEGDVYFPEASKTKTVTIEKVLLKNIRVGFLDQTTTDFQSFTYEEKLAKKREVISQDRNRPKFIYAHSGPGHTVTDPRLRRSEKEELERYLKCVDIAKAEMIGDLNAIKDWDNSVIIVASDHGGILNMEENKSGVRKFIDKHGILLAIKWPKGYEPKMDVSFAPNVMLEVMICLTGDKELVKHKQPGYLCDYTTVSNIHRVDWFKDGKIVSGEHCGKDFFDAAREELQAMKVK